MSKVFSEFTQEDISDRVLKYIDNNEDIGEISKWIDELDNEHITNIMDNIILCGKEEIIKYIIKSNYDIQDFHITLILLEIHNTDILQSINDKYHDKIQDSFEIIMSSNNPKVVKYVLNNNFFDLTPDEILVKFSCSHMTTYACRIFLEVESLDNISQRALDIALHNYCITGSYKIANILIDIGANLNAIVDKLAVSNTHIYCVLFVARYGIKDVTLLTFVSRETGINLTVIGLRILFSSIILMIKNLSFNVETKLIKKI